MIVDEVHETIPFEQKKWLEKDINFNTQKKQAKNGFGRNFY